MRGKRRRIAVFGGSFNPIHNGHLLLAGDLIRQDLADEVLFVPARTPPHKAAVSLVSAEHRMAMVELAVGPYPEFGVSDIELSSDRKTGYTIDTLDALSRAFVDADFYFIIGMDSLQELPTWYHAAELVSRYHFIIYPRPGVLVPAHADLANRLGPRNASKLINSIVDSPSVAISATGVRETVPSGKLLAGLVPPDVEHYIREHKLYEVSKA